MRAIAKNWKALVALLLLLAALAVYFLGYRAEEAAFEQERDQLSAQNDQLQTTIVQNERYKDVQDQLEPALEAISESRAALYDVFPSEMREEDQILYLMYLNETLGTADRELGYTQELHELFMQWFGEGQGNIEFTFGSAAPIQVMSDGAVLQGLDITVYYHASYADLKNIVQALATDDRITSIRYGTFHYSAAEEKLVGEMHLRIYLMRSLLDSYEEPEVTTPQTGKTDIFN